MERGYLTLGAGDPAYIPADDNVRKMAEAQITPATYRYDHYKNDDCDDRTDYKTNSSMSGHT